jgi:lipid-binding SYLF domain-containing protein
MIMKCVSQPFRSVGASVLRSFIILFLAGGLSGCASLSLEQRAELDDMAEANLKSMADTYAGLDRKLEECLGYVALDAYAVKIPIIGWGGGKGVVVDNADSKRTYVKVSRLDIGGGGGIREFDVLILLNDEKLLRQAKAGKRVYGAGAEASAGTASVEGSSGQLQANKPYELFLRSERGASVTWTLHTIRFKPYRD